MQLVRCLALAVAFASLSSIATAQLQVAALRGIVVDGQLQVVAGARVVLADVHGSTVASRVTGADGTCRD